MQKSGGRKDNHLEEAIALLIHTQANFVAQLADTNRENQKTFSEIRSDFEKIMAILLRHERILSELPDAIRQKIGFQPS